MPDVDLPSWVSWMLVAGIVAGALTAIVRAIGRGWSGMTWLGAVTRDKLTAPEREAIEDIRRTQAIILDELRPNGTKSLRDGVDRIEAKLDEHIGHSASDRADLRRWLETIDPGGPG